MRRSSLSILIPLYNEEEFIQSLLERVLDAPLPDGMEREVIVVNDCSRRFSTPKSTSSTDPAFYIRPNPVYSTSGIRWRISC